MFYKSFTMWGPLCNDSKLCFPGCQESCSFHRSHHEVELFEIDYSNVAHPLKYTYLAEKDSIQFEWSRPNGDHQSGQLVYMISLRDELSGSWQQLKQTFYHNATVRRGLLKSSSHFRLISFDSKGNAAQIEKACSDLDLGSAGEEMFADEAHSDGHQEEIYDNTWMPVLQSVGPSRKHSAGVDAIISWPHYPYGKQIKYVIEWNEAEQNSVDSLLGQLSTHNDVAIITLWPNTIYQLNIRAKPSTSHRSIAQSATLIIDTGVYKMDNNNHSSELNIVKYSGMTLIILALSLLIAASLIIIYCRNQGQALNKAKARQAVLPTRRSSNTHASVKRQISSLSARITQNTPSVKHDRLIDEEPLSIQAEHNEIKRSCNV